ncbi:MAG TPA: hypothetical protein VLI07_18540 [Candidatus Binatus sp.]|nr:hypothetical protein [Candidatus Binatus sp.]
MLKRKYTEEERRKLLTTQGDLSALATHPAWPTFEARIEEKRETIEKHVLSLALTGRGELNTHSIEYWRGFLQGMAWLAAVPAGAEQRLESLLKEKGVA